MDFKLAHFQLLLEYIKVFLWPALFILFIFLFKNQISEIFNILLKLFGEAEKFKYGDFEVSKQKANFHVKSNERENISNEEIKENTIRNDKDKPTKQNVDYEEELATLKTQLEFEKIYRIIFGEQIWLLKDLNIKGPAKTRKYFEDFFVHIQNVHNPVFNSWNLDQYLSFLLSTLLIDHFEAGYKITEKGKSFLAYLAQSGYPENKAL